MAINQGGQITDDDDLVKATFEPNLARFLTDIDETVIDYTELHKTANDDIYDKLIEKDVVPGHVDNVYTYKLPSLYFVLAHIWLGRVEELEDIATYKYEQYLKLYNDYMEDPLIVLSEADADGDAGNRVQVSNIDARSRLGTQWDNK